MLKAYEISHLFHLRIFPYPAPSEKPTLKEETFAEETFASGKIREIFGRNFREFRELANFGFFARIILIANSCFKLFF